MHLAKGYACACHLVERTTKTVLSAVLAPEAASVASTLEIPSKWIQATVRSAGPCLRISNESPICFDVIYFFVKNMNGRIDSDVVGST
eukprot:m.95498 g.95498  ORF g.95498 m.95498 type:complete len:88 (+) comp14769_c0_seq1:237-500(+)